MSETFKRSETDYIFLCKKCRERLFVLLEDGTVECDNCKTRFSFIKLTKTWEKVISEKTRKKIISKSKKKQNKPSKGEDEDKE